MTCSRRDMTLLFAAATGAMAQDAVLPSKTYKFEDLKVRENGKNRSRAVFKGKTHTGQTIETHRDRVGAGVGPTCSTSSRARRDDLHPRGYPRGYDLREKRETRPRFRRLCRIK